MTIQESRNIFVWIVENHAQLCLRAIQDEIMQMLINSEKKLNSIGNKIISGQKGNAYWMYDYGGFFSKGAILLLVCFNSW